MLHERLSIHQSKISTRPKNVESILGMMRRSKAIKKKSEMADAEPKAKKAKVDIPDADDEDLNLDDSTDDSGDEEEGMKVLFFLKYFPVFS